MKHLWCASLIAIGAAWLAAPLGAGDVDSSPELSDIVSVARERASRLDRLSVSWSHEMGGAARFSRFQSEWVRPNGTPAETRDGPRLQIDGERFLYDSIRWPVGVLGYSMQDLGTVTSTIGEYFPERTPRPFDRARALRFRDAGAEYAPAQKFFRSFDGRKLRDFWRPITAGYPRATIHVRPEYGSPAWATFAFEDHPSHQVQTLDLMAAILAICPLHPLLEFHWENVQLEPQQVLAEGRPCLVLTEQPRPGAEVTRTLWLDPARDFVVRRYIGETPDGGAQIDIRYHEDNELGWLPASWTVMRFGVPGRPMQQFADAAVTKVDAAPPLPDESLAVAYPEGTWVDDEPAGRQYLVRAAGEQRLILAEELQWLPTHEELMRTESGKVGALIESEIRWKRFAKGVNLPLVLTGFVLIAAAVVWLRLRPKGSSKAETS